MCIIGQPKFVPTVSAPQTQLILLRPMVEKGHGSLGILVLGQKREVGAFSGGDPFLTQLDRASLNEGKKPVASCGV